MKKERIEEITLLRALAFMAITMQHCIAEYIYRPDILQPDGVMLAMLYHFTRFGTPTFVFLSGVILFYNYAGRTLDYGSYLYKRIRDILLPFIVWTVIYWLSVSLYAGLPLGSASSLAELGRQLFQPTYGYHLWFILMIFQFYLLFPLFLKAGDKLGPWVSGAGSREGWRIGWLLAAAGLLYGLLMWFAYYRAGTLTAELPDGLWKWLLVHRTKWFPFYLFYFILGAVCAVRLLKFREFAVRSLVWSGLVFIGLYVWAGYRLLQVSTDKMMLGVSTYLHPFIFVLIVCQLMLAYGVAVLLNRYGGLFKRFMLFVGSHSFGAFLAHAFVLMLVSAPFKQSQLAGYHLPAAVLTFLVVASVSIGLSALFSRLPYGWLLSGAQARKRRTVPAVGGFVAHQASETAGGAEGPSVKPL
ncbi:acyltransferase [Paenibacillus sambharensis]|uniref:Acyltransferase n=1 Tax=Paenibacillus sambharensis TaxID=1803190 RepID=A0A2W1LVB4_9BACL|nr:acyltransferase [Paenibacillus sambharensis]PZD95447.1 acyltransferase [Paenibacillus sambharensis]